MEGATVEYEGIRKPDGDDRRYARVTLANGLRAVVVSDLAADKAAAALDVGVGSLSDPAGLPGLAHFCEHLLFMGTAKFPAENEYSRFLSAHGGASNAYTAGEHTNYFFDVGAGDLHGALDRFAQFFVAPLFDESCTDRELNAVDSEHKKNIQSDMWRNYQLQRDLSDPAHPFHKFATGNLETLKTAPMRNGIDARAALLDFYRQHYSANTMTLAVLGKQPIDELVGWVVSLFSAIENKNHTVPVYPTNPLTPEFLGKEIRVRPVKEMRSLQLTFPFPDTREQYLARPDGYVSHLLGHEGPGSVLSLLKKLGWAQTLSAGVTGMHARGFDIYGISIELTDLGLDHYEEIILIVFQYIHMIQNSPIEHWIFHECQAIAEIGFRFMEKYDPASYVSSIAERLQNYRPEHVLTGPYLMEVFDQGAIKRCIDALRHDSFRVFLVSHKFDTEGWSLAPHYGTPYTVRDFSSSLRERLASTEPNPELFLPERNAFIPENFDVKKVDVTKPKTHPSVILDTPVIRMWHKRDDTFFVPKAYAFFLFSSPIAYDSARSCVLTNLFADLLKDVLNEYSYFAEIAGLDYKFRNSVEGLSLSLHGYNDKMHVLFEKIIERLNSLHIDPSTFARIKERFEKSQKNFSNESPHTHAMYYVTQLTQEKLFTHSEKLAVLGSIGPSDLAEFIPKLLANMHVEALVHGNIDRERAIEYSKIMLDRLRPTELPESQRFCSVRTRLVPENSSIVHVRDVPNPKNPNSAIEYYLQVGPDSDADLRTKLSLVAQIASEPAFHQLRTQEQLGYMVFTGIRRQTGLISYRLIIQSERDPAFLESRIIAFLNQFETSLEAMSDEEYTKHQTALVTEILEKLKKMSQEAGRLWDHINSHYYDFERHLADAEKIPHTTKESLLEFYRKYISPKSQTKRKFSVHIRSQIKGQTTCAEGQAVLDASTILDARADIDAFKAGLDLSDAPSPVKPIEEWN